MTAIPNQKPITRDELRIELLEFQMNQAYTRFKNLSLIVDILKAQQTTAEQEWMEFREQLAEVLAMNSQPELTANTAKPAATPEHEDDQSTLFRGPYERLQ